MNGKQCKAIRRVARTKAHSYSEQSITHSHPYSLSEGFTFTLNYNQLITIDKEKKIGFTRTLHPFSLKAIVKKRKKMFKETFPKNDRAVFAMSNIAWVLENYSPKE